MRSATVTIDGTEFTLHECGEVCVLGSDPLPEATDALRRALLVEMRRAFPHGRRPVRGFEFRPGQLFTRF